MSNSVVRTAGRVRNQHRRRAALVLCATVPFLAACATGFSSPTRHAVANLQAATAKLGTNLEIQGAIIALPSGSVSAKSGLAYLQFEAINFSHEADQLLVVTVAPSSGAAASASAGSQAAGALQAASATAIPAATGSGPGTLRVSVLLRDLTAPLQQGSTVAVGLTFKNSGSVSGLLVPVQSADAVGKSFLPSAPPPAPAAASASTSAVTSPAASTAPASPSAPVGTAPASTAPSPAPATTS